jgi:putative Mn2+ efflux pump MntP
MKVKVSVEDGIATYAVAYDGEEMLCPSRLGLQSNIGDFTKGLTFVEAKESKVEKHYDMTRTKASHVDFMANQLEVTLADAKQHQVIVTFVVSDNDIAFRYTLLRQENDNPKSAVITSEASSFLFPEGTTTFLSPQSIPMVGWERTKPSYEEEYTADRPMTAKSQQGQGYVFPALFHIGDKGWALVCETGVTSAYAGSHLSDYTEAAGYTIAYPQQGENNGNGTATAGIPLPGSTPWRTITIGKTLQPIVETTISYDVLEPLYEPSKQYLPGRYTWSWLIWQDESINYADQVQFIDLAAAMGFEYCLVDNWWDTRIGRDRIEELSKYAQSKGVHLMLWYNSNGYENNAPQTPRQCMNTSIAREKEMRWMQSIGIAGIKVDFFGGDKQQTMQLYEDILSDANRYGLQVIFHGCTLPRGWERMYPNFVASEAVLASENVFFNEGAAIREPFDLTLHPFCRNATATMDWGGIIMNRHMSRDNKSRHTRKTTDVFEIASGIIMRRIHWRTIIIMSFFFGLFQALMPLGGWFCASRFYHLIESVDHWIAFGLLAFLGIRMIKENFSEEEKHSFDPTLLKVVLALAVATSIDAMAVGISFAFVGMTTFASILFPIIIIGIVSFIMSIIGNLAGVYLGKRVNLHMELWGGIILIGIGVKILIEHLS